MQKIATKICCVGLSLFLLVNLVGAIDPLKSNAASAKPTISVTRCSTGIVTIKAGSSYNLGVKAGKATVSYGTSRKKCVVVSKKGVVKGLKPGVSVIRITAKNKGKTTTKKVSVKVVNKKKYVKVKSIKAKVANLELFVGDSIQTQIAFTPKNASNRNLMYSVSDSSVIYVNETGRIKAKSAGKSQVIIKSCDNKKAKAIINVKIENGSSSAVTGGANELVEVKPYIEEHSKDSDGDGYPDYIETNYMGTNPNQTTQAEDINQSMIVTSEGVREVDLTSSTINPDEVKKYYSETDNTISLLLPLEYESTEIGSILALNPCTAYPYGASVIVESIKKIDNSSVLISGTKPAPSQVMEFVCISSDIETAIPIEDDDSETIEKSQIKKKTYSESTKETLASDDDIEIPYDLRNTQTKSFNASFGKYLSVNVKTTMYKLKIYAVGYMDYSGISNISLAPVLSIFKLKEIIPFKTTYLDLDAHGKYDLTANLSIEAKGGKKFTLPAMLLPLNCGFVINLGFKYSAHANLSLEFISKFDYNIHYDKKNNKLEGSGLKLHTPEPIPRTTGNLHLDFKVYAEAAIAVLGFNLVSAGVEFGPRLDITLKTTSYAMICFDVDFSIDLVGYIRLDILGIFESLKEDQFKVKAELTEKYSYWHYNYHTENGIRVDECIVNKIENGKLKPGLYDKKFKYIKNWDDLAKDNFCMCQEKEPGNPNTTWVLSRKKGGQAEKSYPNQYVLIFPETMKGKPRKGKSKDVTVSSIRWFSSDKKLYGIIIPKNIVSIDNSAFMSDTSLSMIMMEDGVNSIGNKAFEGVEKLYGEDVFLPKSIKTIGTNAFSSIGRVIYDGTASGAPWGAEKVVTYEQYGSLEINPGYQGDNPSPGPEPNPTPGPSTTPLPISSLRPAPTRTPTPKAKSKVV